MATSSSLDDIRGRPNFADVSQFEESYFTYRDLRKKKLPKQINKGIIQKQQ